MAQIRQLLAIIPPLSGTDIVGYSVLMRSDEQKACELLKKNREIEKPIIERIKELGDVAMVNLIRGSSVFIKKQGSCSQPLHPSTIIFNYI